MNDHRELSHGASPAEDLRRLAALEADLKATRSLDGVITRLPQSSDPTRARQLGRLPADYDFDAAMPLLEGLVQGMGNHLDR